MFCAEPQPFFRHLFVLGSVPIDMGGPQWAGPMANGVSRNSVPGIPRRVSTLHPQPANTTHKPTRHITMSRTNL